MALEIRIKDQVIATLQAKITELTAANSQPEPND